MEEKPNSARPDHWKCFIVDAGLKILKEHGRQEARDFMIKHKVATSVIDRVLNYPEQRRQRRSIE